jgi:hypothetical protein
MSCLYVIPWWLAGLSFAYKRKENRIMEYNIHENDK